MLGHKYQLGLLCLSYICITFLIIFTCIVIHVYMYFIYTWMKFIFEAYSVINVIFVFKYVQNLFVTCLFYLFAYAHNSYLNCLKIELSFIVKKLICLKIFLSEGRCTSHLSLIFRVYCSFIWVIIAASCILPLLCKNIKYYSFHWCILLLS